MGHTIYFFFWGGGASSLKAKVVNILPFSRDKASDISSIKVTTKHRVYTHFEFNELCILEAWFRNVQVQRGWNQPPSEIQ